MHSFTLSLTTQQAAFLQTYLPLCHSLHPAPPDSKRLRHKKGLDDIFTDNFDNTNKKPTPGKNTTATTPSKRNSTRPPLPTQTNNPPSPRTHQKESPSKHKQQTKKNGQSELDSWMNRVLRALKNDKSSKPFHSNSHSTHHQPQHPHPLHQPIDLRTIERNIKSGLYKNHQQFDSDIRTIISNSYQLNPPNTPHHSTTLLFQEFYTQLLIELPPPVHPTTEPTNSHPTPSKPDHRAHKKEPRSESKIGESGGSEQGQGQLGQSRWGIKELKFREREKMFNKINRLSQESLCTFIKLCGVNTTSEWSQMEIDLAYLSEDTFRKIEAFLGQQ